MHSRMSIADPPLPFVFQLCCLSKEEVIPGVTDLVSMLIIMILILPCYDDSIS